MAQQRKLKKGSVLKIWHTNQKGSIRRGNNYVVVGEDPVNKEIILLKANSFNNDGTIHKAVKKPHCKLKYAVLGDIKIVKGVSYCEKKPKDISLWANLETILPKTARPLSNIDEYVCTPKGTFKL